MSKVNWKPYAIFILLTEGVGALSGFLSREGMQAFSRTAVQPPLSPPGWVFPLVWTVLYALMGFGAARLWQTPPGKARSTGLNLYIVQLVVNFFWSLIFFNAGAYGAAFWWLLLLLGLVCAMTLTFSNVDTLAAYAQIPYILWLFLAAWLNFGTWQLNG